MEFFGCLGAIIGLAFFLAPIVALAYALGHRSRITALEEEVKRLRVADDQLRQRIANLTSSASEPEAESAVEAPPPATGPVEWILTPPPAASPGEPGHDLQEPESAPPSTVPTEAASPPPSPASPIDQEAVNSAYFEVSHDEPRADLTASGEEPAVAGQGEEPALGGEPAVETPPPIEPPPPTPPPPGGFEEAIRNFDWENLIGVKLFSWIAAVALALAGVFFLKYSFDHGLLQPPIRMALGFVTGVGLLVVCELKIARGYRVTANAMDAAGIAILYATLFASHSLWDLIPSTVTFGLMILVTATAVLLSIRRDSVFIALLGLVGGFATPALLSTGEDHPISLFSYLLLLNAGLAWVAYKKRWPALSVLTLIFTTIYQWGWVIRFLGESKLSLAAGIFLAFPLLSVGAFLAGGRDPEAKSNRTFGTSAALGALVPITLAVYLAAVPAYGARFHLLFGFLLIVDLGLAALAASQRGPRFLHAIGAISTLVVVLVWLGLSWIPAAWPAILAWISIFVTLYAAAPVAADRIGSSTRFDFVRLDREAEGAVWTSPLLLVAFSILPSLDGAMPRPALPFTVLAMLVVVIAASCISRRRSGPYELAAFLTIVAEAIWSANHLSKETLLATLLVYGAFGLIFMAVPVVARRRGCSSESFDSTYPLILSILLLFFLAGGSVAGSALAGITALLILFVGGTIIASRFGRLPLAPAIAMALGWIVLAVWWTTATVVANLIAALTTIALFASVVLVATVWLRRENEVADRPWNAWFALAGHAFLFVVAARPELGIPPWPLFAVLALLMVAVAIAAKLLEANQLLIADAIATQIVLLTWAAGAKSESWPTVAIVASLVVAAFFVVWRRVSQAPEARRSGAPFAALFIAQFVVMIASGTGRPPFAVTLVAQLALLVTILILAAVTEHHEVAVFASITAAFAYFLYRGEYVPERWRNEIAFATSVYAAFIVSPIALGRRVGKRLEPHLAAVVASAFYFLFARTSIEWRGLGGGIGILPLAQAAVLAIVLRSLLRIEPPGERTMGRLAMVAGVILAFVTVAIPLQLDKEWITIGWALEGAALLWLFRRIPHRGLLAWGSVLLAIVFVRLSLNPAVFDYHPRSATPIWNWYLYTYAVAAGAFFFAAKVAPKAAAGKRAWLRSSLASGGTVLLFLLLNIEIADFFSKGPTITFNFSAGLAQDLTYTLGWAVFAIGLLTAGLVGRNRATRMASIGLLLVSVLKGFLHDLMRLGGLYRVGSLIGLAVALALVAVLLQKFVLATRAQKEGVPE